MSSFYAHAQVICSYVADFEAGFPLGEFSVLDIAFADVISVKDKGKNRFARPKSLSGKPA
jgi:hypothetical protein